MKLATLKSNRIDGVLVVVSRDLAWCEAVPQIAPTLQGALDTWDEVLPALTDVYQRLNSGQVDRAQRFNDADVSSPLPRAYQWCDGGTFRSHMELMTKWMNHTEPTWFRSEPLVYQGGSDAFIGPRDPIVAASEEHGIDFESEVAVITDRVPMGTSLEDARKHIKLVMLCNDVSLRNLIPHELGKGFGFYQSKPASAFSPVAVTPDELGDAWDGDRLHLPLISTFNGAQVGCPNAGAMEHGFPGLVAHSTRTREVGAGSIFGSGTVANADRELGSSCLIEMRVIEMLANGNPETEFMKFGDRIRIEMFDAAGKTIFGAIDQTVAKLKSARL